MLRAEVEADHHGDEGTWGRFSCPRRNLKGLPAVSRDCHVAFGSSHMSPQANVQRATARRAALSESEWQRGRCMVRGATGIEKAVAVYIKPPPP